MLAALDLAEKRDSQRQQLLLSHGRTCHKCGKDLRKEAAYHICLECQKKGEV
jgi:predicted amidophosphoribosyltransferase